MTFLPHPITGVPIGFAPERASRPGAFGGADTERCPFCPGNESDTPATIAAAGDPWRVRVFRNKYPSVEDAEVIVESAQHDATFDRIGHAQEAVRMYVDRYCAQRPLTAHVSLFKNEGPGAGTSIPHIHSQVMPLPFVPPRVSLEGAAFRARYCPLCRPLDAYIIRETASFTWLVPAASWMPYQQWIVPKRHMPEMSAFEEPEIAELAVLLQAASKAMLTLGNSYNWIFMNFARRKSAHFYVELFPRMAAFGGFELGTGTFVQIVEPALAAQRLQSASADPAPLQGFPK
jgi:UDPglucose--hexose-1-phosphate uridylyltransferase